MRWSNVVTIAILTAAAVACAIANQRELATGVRRALQLGAVAALLCSSPAFADPPTDGGAGASNAPLVLVTPPAVTLPSAAALDPRLSLTTPAPVTAAPAAAPWWRPVVTAAVSLAGAGLILMIRHYVPAADPCAAVPSSP